MRSPPAPPASLAWRCAASADPEGALQGSLRALEARAELLGRRTSGGAPVPLQGPRQKQLLELLVLLSAASRYLPAHLAARPRLLDLLAQPRFLLRARTWSSAREAALRLLRRIDVHGAGAIAAFGARLRRHKVVEVLRIALRDLTGRAQLPEVAAELSFLAAAAFEAAVQIHFARLCDLHGRPAGCAEGASGFCVLGMGKLGGLELNFSSDVDVLYVYGQEGHTQGGSAGPLEHSAFYARLAEEVTRTIGGQIEGGFVFRVDLDLRPDGRSGPLVNSLRGLELYYEGQGADWERFALLKARPIAGDLAVGEEALRRLTPFVFRKYLDLGAVESVRALKARAEREAAKRGGLDLKLGPGGIREVEFFVQALQLLHGGRDLHLRERNTLRALSRLVIAGLIHSRDRTELAEAYLLLRQLEHRVQMVAERQTHALPEEPQERERLARRAGFPGWSELEAALDSAREAVSSRFSDLLRVAGGKPDPADPRATLAADPLATDDERTDALARLGFAAPEAGLAELDRLRKRRGSPFHPKAPAELAALGPVYVGELAQVADPDRALRHLSDLYGALGEPIAVTRLLASSPRTTRLLFSLFGTSDFLSRALVRHPELIDQLVHRGASPIERTPADLHRELSDRIASIPPEEVEGALGEVRAFKNQETLRIGLHDVAGTLSLESVGGQLSDLADVCVGACLALANREVRLRDGIPRGTDGAEARLSVIGLGTLGARELAYHSDLDLLFLYSGDGETDGAHRSTSREHFARVAQRLISHLTLHLREGTLYRIDARLRPSGSAGALVVSFDALARYHRDDAHGAARLWERQALLRARLVAGDGPLFARAEREVLVPSLFREVDGTLRATLAAELWAMRDRIEREIAAESADRYNSKLGRGGLIDVEFAVQFLQLVHGLGHPEVRGVHTTTLLAALRDSSLLAPEEFLPLDRGWRFLRRLESRLRLERDRAIDHLPTSGRELELLGRRLGYSSPRAGAGLLSDYARATAGVRAALLRVLGLQGAPADPRGEPAGGAA